LNFLQELRRLMIVVRLCIAMPPYGVHSPENINHYSKNLILSTTLQGLRPPSPSLS